MSQMKKLRFQIVDEESRSVAHRSGLKQNKNHTKIFLSRFKTDSHPQEFYNSEIFRLSIER